MCARRPRLAIRRPVAQASNCPESAQHSGVVSFSPGAWLHRVPTSDPLERKNAATVQVFCFGLTALLIVSDLAQVRHGIEGGPIAAYGMFADLSSIAASLLGIVLIRRGRIRQGFVTVLG